MTAEIWAFPAGSGRRGPPEMGSASGTQKWYNRVVADREGGAWSPRTEGSVMVVKMRPRNASGFGLAVVAALGLVVAGLATPAAAQQRPTPQGVSGEHSSPSSQNSIPNRNQQYTPRYANQGSNPMMQTCGGYPYGAGSAYGQPSPSSVWGSSFASPWFDGGMQDAPSVGQMYGYNNNQATFFSGSSVSPSLSPCGGFQLWGAP